MNRRGFLSLFGKAAVGATVAYSFPSIIVPKNLAVIEAIKQERLPVNLITKKEIFPELIQDLWFTDSPFFAYLRNTKLNPIQDIIEPFGGEIGLKFDERLVMR